MAADQWRDLALLALGNWRVRDPARRAKPVSPAKHTQVHDRKAMCALVELPPNNRNGLIACNCHRGCAGVNASACRNRIAVLAAGLSAYRMARPLARMA